MGIGNDMIIINQYIILLLRPQFTSTLSPFFRTFVTYDRNCFEKKNPSMSFLVWENHRVVTSCLKHLRDKSFSFYISSRNSWLYHILRFKIWSCSPESKLYCRSALIIVQIRGLLSDQKGINWYLCTLDVCLKVYETDTSWIFHS